MRLLNATLKMLLFLVITGPFLIVGCDKDDDDNGEPSNTEEENKPPEGESNFTVEEGDVSIPDSVFFYDSSNYRIGLDDTASQALVLGGANDSGSMEVIFAADNQSEVVGEGTYEVKELGSGTLTGVEATVISDGDIWSTYSLRGDKDLGEITIHSRSGSNVFGEFKDVVFRSGNNTTATFTLNGYFNADKN